MEITKGYIYPHDMGDVDYDSGVMMGWPVYVDVPVDNSVYLKEAQAIVKDTGVTFPNLRAWEGYEDVLDSVGTPTTYFVDSQGKIVGEPILGANVEKYKEKMEQYLSEAK